jgi:HlyD family secretion protein
MKRAILAGLSLALLLGGCKKAPPPPMYIAMPVGHRDIVVSALASGAVEAITVVNVKSRASGTILRMPAQTGMHVHRGDTLVLVDKRDPTNSYNQAQSELAVARATLQNAQANKQRIDAMFAGQLASEQDHETANLQYSTAQAQLVRAQIALQQAHDALSDCNVLASVNGVVLTKGVDVGTVIASAVNQVSGGTTLLTMANLDTVQLRVQVDETDIGKIQPGLEASITVDAFPNRPFHGNVLKIEPQSTTNNNVTMFPVLIWIPNVDGLLLPGMNAEVEIHVSNRPGVLAIPNAALRTPRDVNSAAAVLGLTPDQVTQTLARADSQASRASGASGAMAAGGAGTAETAGSMGGATPSSARGDSAKGNAPRAGRGGRGGGGSGGGGGGGGQDAAAGGSSPGSQSGQSGQGAQRPGVRQSRAFFSGSYIVFLLKNGQPVPVRIRVGVTDMDYSEVTSGLTDRDTVLLLPSASLVQSQADMKDRFNRMTGGGVPGMKQATPVGGAAGGGGAKGGR